ncbi:hypothetical protein EJV47_27285, partial [Hymenobacter gummosus]
MLLLAFSGLLLLACHRDPPEKPLPNAPLLEAVPAGYRPVDRQDTVESYYAPYEAFGDSTFQFGAAPASIRSGFATCTPGSRNSTRPAISGTSLCGWPRPTHWPR